MNAIKKIGRKQHKNIKKKKSIVTGRLDGSLKPGINSGRHKNTISECVRK